MRVLITNNALAARAGTELYVRDLALALLKHGHEVVACSTVLGEVADELEAAGVTVIRDPARSPWTPDVIHAHHHLETMSALLAFPRTPAVYVCHGWLPWEEIAPQHPRILRYVAVDRPTQLAVAQRVGLDVQSVRLLPNAIDLARFVPRGPLPPAPRRALLLCNRSRRTVEVPLIREACADKGIELRVFGLGAGRPLRRPERVLSDYDLVFGKGRVAVEAAAVGAAVILCGEFGLGPMVSTTNVESLRTLEGDYRKLCQALSREGIVREIERYDAADAARVSEWVRSVAGLDRLVPQLLSLYGEAIEEHALRPGDPGGDSQAAAAYLCWLSGQLKQTLAPRGPAIHLRNLLLRLRARLPWS
jgi:hypothetical protein